MSCPLLLSEPAVPVLYHVRGLHEPFSALSHLFGAAAFLVLGVRLVRRGRGDAARQAFLAVYAAACVLLMLTSGVYHAAVTDGPAHRVLLRLDHGAIFVLIAGTFTPLHGLLFRGPLRWVPLAVVWAAAAAGVVLKTAFIHSVAEWVGLTLYLALGWFGAFAGILLWRRRGFAFVRPLLLGGLAYSVGAAVEFLRWPGLVRGVVHPHEVFHLAVLAGAVLHYAFVWQFAAPPAGAAPCPLPRDE